MNMINVISWKTPAAFFFYQNLFITENANKEKWVSELSPKQTKEHWQLHTVNKLICRIRKAKTLILFYQKIHH